MVISQHFSGTMGQKGDLREVGKEQNSERLLDAVKIGNGLTAENEKLRPSYRPFSCCLAIL